jgi:hypothetical protein
MGSVVSVIFCGLSGPFVPFILAVVAWLAEIAAVAPLVAERGE